MDNFDLKNYLAEGKLLKENAPGYDTRKTGEALPTLENVNRKRINSLFIIRLYLPCTVCLIFTLIKRTYF